VSFSKRRRNLKTPVLLPDLFDLVIDHFYSVLEALFAASSALDDLIDRIVQSVVIIHIIIVISRRKPINDNVVMAQFKPTRQRILCTYKSLARQAAQGYRATFVIERYHISGQRLRKSPIITTFRTLVTDYHTN